MHTLVKQHFLSNHFLSIYFVRSTSTTTYFSPTHLPLFINTQTNSKIILLHLDVRYLKWESIHDWWNFNSKIHYAWFFSIMCDYPLYFSLKMKKELKVLELRVALKLMRYVLGPSNAIFVKFKFIFFSWLYRFMYFSFCWSDKS